MDATGANKTHQAAGLVHGQDPQARCTLLTQQQPASCTPPQNIIEKIVRMKMYETAYWKEHCFGLTAAGIVEKAVRLRYVAGTYGGNRVPSEFMCLVLKMLQIQPEKEIILEYIRNEEYKYVRILGAFYLRLVGRALDVYNYLEPLYNDYRRVRTRLADGSFSLSHVDALVDEMLHSDYLFDIALPRLQRRLVLEGSGALEPRVSVLDEEFDEAALEEEATKAAQAAKEAEEAAAKEGKALREQQRSPRRERWRRSPGRRPRSPEDRRRPRSGSRDRRRSRSRDRRRDRDDDRRRSRSRDRRRDRDDDRRRSRSRDRRRDKGQAGDEQDPEIAEANALRAKLGLKPLRG